MKRPPSRSPRRSTTRRDPRRVIRVLTEGKATEPGYLTLIGREHRSSITITFDEKAPGSDPLRLVRMAKKHLDVNRRRRKSDGPDFDEIWCVFDVDEHPNIPRARQEAFDAGIKIAISNPCFELWLVLHVQDQTASIHRHKAQQLSKSLGLTSGKSIQQGKAKEILRTSVGDAIERARALDKRHQGDGSPPCSNPSTGVWKLAVSLMNDSRGHEAVTTDPRSHEISLYGPVPRPSRNSP